MPITGSQKALMQARSGIARAGATRAGYYTPNLVLFINGVDRSSSIEIPVTYTQSIRPDEPDTAHFLLKPTAGVTPVENQSVSIGFGTLANVEFAGQIQRVRHVRAKTAGGFLVWMECECVDWSRLFNRRLINAEYASMSATDIAYSLVDSWTSGFTRVNVAAGLPTVDFFPLTNERLTDAFRRLVALMGGGGFYIDASRDVHLFGPAGETGARVPTPPQTLTETRDTLLSFSHERDSSQQRTRVQVEGVTTTTLSAVSAGFVDIPVDSVVGFSASGTARVGKDIITYTSIVNAAAAGNFPTTTVSAAAFAGNASFEVIIPSGTYWTIATFGWVRVGGQYIRYDSVALGANLILQGIPASGPGSFTGDVAVGVEVALVDQIKGIPSSGAGSLTSTVPMDTDVVLRVQEDDSTQQTALAAIEGGDGIHEHLISDGRLTDAGAIVRGDTDLDIFSTALVSAEWDTEDLNARPGRMQAISFSATDTLSTTLLITRVETEVRVKNRVPLRKCSASTLQFARLLDVAETAVD